MKYKAWLLVAAFALFNLSPLRPGAQIKSLAATGIKSQASASVEERIKRVEAGLLPRVVIKGQPLPKANVRERMNYYAVPGVSVAVINNGAIEWARSYGTTEAGSNRPVVIETLFQAASISKPVAAVGALYLVDKGKLKLDEDVNLKLTSWKVPENEFTKEKKVTLRALLTHSAGTTVHGFRGYASDEAVPALVELLDGKKPANSGAIRVDIVPGTKWRYSGGGTSVSQQLVMDVTRKPFAQFMKETVLDRIGMKNSTYEQPLPNQWRERAATGHRQTGEIVKGKWHTYPEQAAAGLWTTPSDLARFAIELQKSRAGKSNKVLSKAMTENMLKRQFENWGLGISVGGSGRASTFSHGGSNEGFRCQLFAYAETGQGAVVMTNSDNGSPLANEILRAIAAEYGWPDYKVEERDIIKVDPAVYSSYAGEYRVMGLKITTISEAGRLFVIAPPIAPDKIELYPETETKYFVVEDDVRFTFVKDENAKVTGIIVQAFGQTLKGNKVK
jgi:CubicO group peptidase (beta-lactamase class C family)